MKDLRQNFCTLKTTLPLQSIEPLFYVPLYGVRYCEIKYANGQYDMLIFDIFPLLLRPSLDKLHLTVRSLDIRLSSIHAEEKLWFHYAAM